MLVTVDPHLHRYPALSALYTILAETLHAAPLLEDWIAADVDQPFVVSVITNALRLRRVEL